MVKVITFPKSQRPRPRLAVIGSGISGLGAAWRLGSLYDVTLFERNDRLGGHSHTTEVECENGTFPVDTGFIVYNEANYPNLTGLFKTLGVPTIPSDMSFAASLGDGDFEYSGSGISGLFAQRRNMVRPRMWRMIGDLLRLYRDGPQDLTALTGDDEHKSLDDYLDDKGFSQTFRNDHILPMCAAIWSSPVETMRQFPARSFLKFFENHGLMRISGRPEWRTVFGGSREYVSRLIEDTKCETVLNARIVTVKRNEDKSILHFEDRSPQEFDHIVFACHSDEALALLDQPTPDERKVLGAIGYQENAVYLHRDTSFMPQRRNAWSSWNYLSGESDKQESNISLTYWMNRLQSIPTKTPLLVTLNPSIPPLPETVFNSFAYTHPVFDADAMKAQRELWTLQGVQNTWFCGAYWGYGFHEDGLQSGLAVAEALGAPARPWTHATTMERIYWPNHPTWKDTSHLQLKQAN